MKPLFSVLLLATTSACSLADGSTRSPRVVDEVVPVEAAFVPLPDDLSLDARLANVEALLASLRTIDGSSRKRVSDAVDRLDGNCPYTRLSHQLALALHQEVRSIDSRHLGMVQLEWEKLQRGLALHAELLGEVGVQLRQPGLGDFLHGESMGVLIDLRTLRQLDEPMEASVALVDATSRLVVDLPDDVIESIMADARVVESSIGRHPSFRDELRGWMTTLQELEPSIVDDRSRNRVRRFIEILGVHAEQGC